MTPLAQLQKAAADGLAFLRAQPDVQEGEVFVSSNGVLLTRLNYPSNIPCNGVEEPKSIVNYGIGVQAVFKAAGPGDPSTGSGRTDIRRIGFGSEAAPMSEAGGGGARGHRRHGG